MNKINIGIISALSVMGATTVVVPSVVAATEPKVEATVPYVIVDTDVGNDCDDIGALTVLGNCYRKHMVDVAAVTVCNQSLPAIYTTDIMLEQYGIDCPIGRADNNQRIHAEAYARAVSEKWHARRERNPQKWKIESATKVLRRALANCNGRKIKLITIGMLNNIANLINSPADEISPKTGRQLFNENISEMVLMAGRFDEGALGYAEFNIKESLASAKTVINTTSVPKTFLGWEVGEPVKTGINFYNNPETPQYVAYNTYNHGQPRQSWDPLTMYISLVDNWGYSEKGDVRVIGEKEEEEGSTIFTPSPNGICRYALIHPNSAKLALQLESWMTVA